MATYWSKRLAKRVKLASGGEVRRIASLSIFLALAACEYDTSTTYYRNGYYYGPRYGWHGSYDYGPYGYGYGPYGYGYYGYRYRPYYWYGHEYYK